MSGSRSSLKKASLVFNPRAENTWSKDESKFGQRMLEKMGWKKGEGVGLNKQGIAENIKIRFKMDSKGLGYKIKEDKWVEVENDFSGLLSHLSQQSDCEKNSKRPSLESTSHSLRSRVHYHKFTRGKDISKYNVKDLMGILGKTNTDDQRNENIESNSKYSNNQAINEADSQKIDADTNKTKIKIKNDGDSIKKKKNNCPSNLKKHNSKTIKGKRKKMKVESEDSNSTNNSKSCDTTIIKRIRKNSDILSTTTECFLESITENNETNNVKQIIKKFEDDEQKLLKKYRENYKMKYLFTVNEKDSHIYCELDGDKLDLKKGIQDDKEVQNLNNLDRKLTKAERIILKARLLKKIQNKDVTHGFKGSNLAEIKGYGINTSRVK